MNTKNKPTKLILSMVVSLGATLTFAQNLANSRTDLEIQNLKGKVKTIKESSYEGNEKEGKITQGKLRASVETNFNTIGNESSWISKDDKGKFESSSEFIYDAKNNILETRTKNAEGKLKTVKWVYDSKGWLISKKEDENDGYTTNMKLDEKGHVLEYETMTNYGSPVSKYAYKYDAKGNNIEHMYYYDESGTIVMGSWYGMKYDEKGNLMEQAEYNVSDSTLVSRETYKYDATGVLLEKQKIDALGKIMDHYVYVYDDKGNDLETLSVSPEGDKLPETRYTYTYDKQGNWISKTGYHHTYNYIVIKREISYY